jgi:flagellar hook assembly protein FlgD
LSLQIFDATGRLIKVIADETMQPGAHQFTWNAKDEKGNAVITGIYFLRFNTGNYSETKKLVVVK